MRMQNPLYPRKSNRVCMGRSIWTVQGANSRGRQPFLGLGRSHRRIQPAITDTRDRPTARHKRRRGKDPRVDGRLGLPRGNLGQGIPCPRSVLVHPRGRPFRHSQWYHRREDALYRPDVVLGFGSWGYGHPGTSRKEKELCLLDQCREGQHGCAVSGFESMWIGDGRPSGGYGPGH